MKVIDRIDSRINAAEFLQAGRNEINVLKLINVWQIEKMADVLSDANILRGRFVYTLKNYQQLTEVPKARFAAQGYDDCDKSHIVHDSSTIRPSSNCNILFTASICGFRIFSHDVTQAYTQRKDKLTRKKYLRIHKQNFGNVRYK